MSFADWMSLLAVLVSLPSAFVATVGIITVVKRMRRKWRGPRPVLLLPSPKKQ